MATVLMPVSSSQSANRWRSPLNVRKVRTGLSSRSPGTATTWKVEPTSIPAASGLIVDNRPEDLPRVFLLPGMLGPPVSLGSRGGATDHFPKRDRLTASPLSSAQATPGPFFLRAPDVTIKQTATTPGRTSA